MNINVKLINQILKTGIIIILIASGSSLTYAETEVSDSEKAAELERKIEEFKLRRGKLPERQDKSADQEDESSEQRYQVMQRKDGSVSSSVRGNDKLNATDIKKGKAKKDKKGEIGKYNYHRPGQQDSAESKRKNRNGLSGGVVGNSKIHTTKIERSKKQKTKNDKRLNNRFIR